MRRYIAQNYYHCSPGIVILMGPVHLHMRATPTVDGQSSYWWASKVVLTRLTDRLVAMWCGRVCLFPLMKNRLGKIIILS